MNTLRRMIVALPALSLILLLGSWNSATAQSFPETIPLPTGFWPEGIVIGDGHTAYVGSVWSGSIYEIDLRTGAGSMLVPGSLPPYNTVGLDFDERSGYLFVAGGFSGNGRVYDTTTGAPIDTFLFGGGWINDVVVTQDAAYFTDSLAPLLYKVPLDSHGMQSSGVIFLPLSGDWVQIPTTDLSNPMINANGIVATPNNGTLIVVNYVLGRLYNVDPLTGYATEIDLGGVSVPSGDGLVLRGKTLYVVQNFANAIAVFTLSPDYSTASLRGYLADTDLRIPATADLFGPWLYTTNPRFDDCPPLICDPSSLDFEIVRVDQ
jgi:hypothetical protein